MKEKRTFQAPSDTLRMKVELTKEKKQNQKVVIIS